MKNFKKIGLFSLLGLSLLFAAKSSMAQTISTHFFGVNAWMPDTIGNHVYNGKLHKHWGDMQNSTTTIIRFGGIAPDQNMPTNYQYIKMIDSSRARGIEPIIQVPYNNGVYTAQQAANIVTYINITKGRHVKYWIIGNEPNLGYSYTTASQVAAYIRPFASAMKNVDPSILIIGPETAGFHTSILTGLTTPGGADDITGKDAAGRYYVDFISFHCYPMGDGTGTRDQLISKLTSSGNLKDNLIYLNSRIAACNSYYNRTGASALKAAITEANVNYTNPTNDNLYGIGSNSFVGGQFYAEILGISLKYGVDVVNLWSVIEGNTTTTNKGYLDNVTGGKKPMYYHFKLMADNFKGSSANCTTNQTAVKSFACKDAQQTCVLILNEDMTTNYNYTVRLNTDAIAGTNPLKINVDAGVSNEYTDVIPNQSSVLLTFNSAGTIIKKCDYSLATHAIANLAPTCTEFNTVDLAITSPSVSSSNVLASGTVSVSSTIFNSGNAAATSSNVGYYLSADSVLDLSDTYLSNSTGSTLNGGSGSTRNAVLTIPSNTVPGNYYILFAADYSNLVTETSETNNVRNKPINVSVPPTTDLIITASSVLPTNVVASGTVSVSSTIFNSGNTAASSSNVGYYFSTDTILDASDTYLSSSTGSTLNAGSGSPRNSILTIPSGTASGNYYILFVADYSHLVTETVETNNVSYLPVNIPVVTPTVDLLIMSPSLSPLNVVVNGTVSVSSTIFNSGNTAAASSNIGYYLSTDTIPDASDIYLSNSDGSILNAGSGSPRNAVLTIPSGTVPGNYYILFMADYSHLVSETVETNNVNYSPINIPHVAPPSTIDLVIKNPSVSPYSVTDGKSVTANCTIFNSGNSASPNSNVGYYLSADTVFNTSDIFLSYAGGSTLNGNSGVVKSTALTIPAGTASGNYYILFVADYSNITTETIETNNTNFAAIKIKHNRSNGPLLSNNNGQMLISQANDTTLGIGQNERVFEMNIFPNPSSGKFTVELNKEYSEGNYFEIKLFNLSGQEVYSKNCGFQDKREQIELDESIAAGTYVLRVKDLRGGNDVTTKRIVVNK